MNTATQMIPLSQLILSSTPMQIERRKYRTKQDIEGLAETIKSVGQLHAIIVRPNPFPGLIKSHDGVDLFEVVAGEGRYLAVEHAGLEQIRAEVRELSDEQVEEIQLIENLQRVGLHELVEAEGFEALLKRGHTAEEIAERTGKSKGTVYARLKLLVLSDDARKAFRNGTVSASIALLIARIPGDEQQARALKHVLDNERNSWRGEPMSYRDAQEYIRDTFMLKLSDAPFNREDGTLVPDAGPCGPCPMRTGNAPDLFGDVKGADVCTNPPCFASKKAAHIKRELEKAKATGDDVIRGSAARRILPDKRGYSFSNDGSHKHLRNGFARPSDKCLDDPKQRTYAELAGKDAPKVLLQNPDTGRVEKIFKVDDIADKLKAKGIKPRPPAKNPTEAREQDQAKRKQTEEIELVARRAIFKEVIAAAPTKLSHEDFATLLSMTFHIGYGDDEEFYAALGWETPKKTVSYDKRAEYFRDRLIEQSEGKLAQLAVALPLIQAAIDTYEDVKDLEATAKQLGVDVKKIRAAAAPAKPEKKAAPKASKKKAAKKK